MARSAVPLIATLIAVVLGALTLGTAAIVLVQGKGGGLAVADWAALRFTLVQAALSALVSAALAIPVARALARRRFPGRNAIITLLGAPFLLPTIVAVFGLIAIFGRSGVVNNALAALHLPPLSIYGLHGVVLAHVFLNLPLATRLLLQGWQSIPAERLRLAASLGFGPAATWHHIERPMLRATLPGTILAIFTICLTSFAVALILGGGPRATTIELAIYQAVRFDFDLPRAATLASLQFAICAAAVGLAAWIATPTSFGAGLDRPLPLFPPRGWRRISDGTIIIAATLFTAAPVLVTLLRGVPGLADLPPQIWPAAARSIAIALAATAIAIPAALALALAAARGYRAFDLAATLPMAASSLVLGTGLFIALQGLLPPTTAAIPLTILVNATLALPFAFRILAPATRTLHADYHRLSTALGLPAITRLRFVALPRLCRPLGFAAGLTAALAMGDLGVIALFGTETTQTLPLAMQRLMGAYRMDQAAAAALILITLTFALFWAFDRWGRHAVT